MIDQEVLAKRKASKQQAKVEPQIVERIVEKVVEKPTIEYIEKVIEKIVEKPIEENNEEYFVRLGKVLSLMTNKILTLEKQVIQLKDPDTQLCDQFDLYNKNGSEHESRFNNVKKNSLPDGRSNRTTFRK